MTIKNIIVGDRILVQSGASVKEVAVVKDICDNGNIIVKLSDGKFAEIEPQYILKSFGQ